jgi:DNA modification methylase
LLQIAGRRVLDPFMGTAPIGEACIITGREYVGAEIVPDTYTLARDRLLGVQSQAGMFPIAPVAGQLFEATA